MNVGQKNSSLNPKKSAKPASSDACRLCGINFKIAVGDFGGKNKYGIFQPERVDKIRLADLLKIHLVVELDPQVGKSSHE